MYIQGKDVSLCSVLIEWGTSSSFLYKFREEITNKEAKCWQKCQRKIHLSHVILAAVLQETNRYCIRIALEETETRKRDLGYLKQYISVILAVIFLRRKKRNTGKLSIRFHRMKRIHIRSATATESKLSIRCLFVEPRVASTATGQDVFRMKKIKRLLFDAQKMFSSEIS